MLEDVFQLCGTSVRHKYHVESVVGRGGFGIVYRGWHSKLDVPIAIKCLIERTESGAARERFLESFRREAQLLNGLFARHPAIVRVYDFDITTAPSGATLPYLILEWLEGQDLEAVLAERSKRGDAPYSEREALLLLRPAIEAIAAAHEGSSAIAHRDLKPANLFVSKGVQPIKVLDFGIAKVMEAGETATLPHGPTGSNFRIFSPKYGAPEQFDSKTFGATGPWTDVHALGLILVELVTGKRALRGEQEWPLLLAATATTRPTARAAGCQVSDAFEQLCSKALALRPSDRYRTAGQLLAAVDAALATSLQPVAATAPAPKPVAARRRWKRWLALAVAVPLAYIGVQIAQRGTACQPGDVRGCSERCELGEAGSCTNLGVMYWNGNGVPKSQPRARRHFRLGCDGNDAAGCTNLGIAYATAGELPTDLNEAAKWYEKGCALGHAAGCVALGRLLVMGTEESNTDAVIAAKQLFKQACDQHLAAGCASLGEMYEHGIAVKADLARALELYDQACAWDEKAACEHAAKLRAP